jgi:hypothetical protein
MSINVAKKQQNSNQKCPLTRKGRRNFGLFVFSCTLTMYGII